MENTTKLLFELRNISRQPSETARFAGLGDDGLHVRATLQGVAQARSQQGTTRAQITGGR